RRCFLILRCRLFLSLRSRIRQALDCSPTNRERELGLDRRETVRIPPRQGNDKFAPRYREVLLCNKCNFLLQLMPYYMVLLFNRMIKWLPKPDNSGTMSGRKITCRRLDYWSRLSHACLSSNKPIMVKPRTAHYNSYNVLDVDYPTWITVAILELIHAPKLRLFERAHLLD
ncbi:Protein HYPER-SENSITIVITY-RELATED, partial [Dirofilaria immitis]